MIRQYSLTELRAISLAFEKEIKISASGGKSSLPFHIHKLPEKPLLEKDHKYQLIIIGGTYYKSTTGVNGVDSESMLKTGEIPLLSSKKIFLDFISNLIESDVDIVGLNFAYSLKPQYRDGRMDGKLEQGSKEHVFDGLEGLMGAEIEKYLMIKTGQNIKITVANDTICLLFSAIKDYSLDKLAALIIGTGLNTAISLNSQTAVNLESANFDKFTQTQEGKEIDNHSTYPGQAKFEKEVAGAYLYKQFNLLSNTIKISSTEELNELARKGNLIAIQLFNRSASLAAAQASAITAFYNKPVTFIVEGSLFWSSEIYFENFCNTYYKLIDSRDTKFIKSNFNIFSGIKNLLQYPE